MVKASMILTGTTFLGRFPLEEEVVVEERGCCCGCVVVVLLMLLLLLLPWRAWSRELVALLLEDCAPSLRAFSSSSAFSSAMRSGELATFSAAFLRAPGSGGREGGREGEKCDG